MVPLTYDLTIHPNLTTFTFSGSVRIAVSAKKTLVEVHLT